MARRNITLIGLLYLAHFTYGKKYHSSRKESYLSCTSYYSGDFVILDCFYRGGLPFPTLTWTGPNNLYREAFNTQRFTINITRQEFVNDWNTIYKCTARRHYSTSYCSVGRVFTAEDLTSNKLVTGYLGMDVELPCQLKTSRTDLKVVLFSWVRNAGPRKSIAAYSPTYGGDCLVEYANLNLQSSGTEERQINKLPNELITNSKATVYAVVNSEPSNPSHK
ncbi:uncharacterized protein LOC125487965 isoform X2 [Rhincodon typus]|uniref:uncharacterized protein LOC125487965 isoform X2 n=1 Tax=Rhincodon typus TaxID=259920 RepID=UPI002030CCB0|nr:uncharacterized protein LOC125487965 isoform X2 [Rhincodon typus]